MRETDIAEFSKSLDSVCGMLSRGNYTPSAPNTTMWFRALAAYPLSHVCAGFDAHVKDPQRGRFVPVPADIIAQIEGLAADDGRPGPEEAWALAIKAADEANTVVWTGEMSQAWALASPLVTGRDQVGARMAFKEAYTRMVDEARRARRPAIWSASLGFDAQQRHVALELAQLAGRLPAPDIALLPAPTEAFEAIADQALPGVLEKLRSLRDRLTRRADEPSLDAIEKQRTADLKAAANRQAETYQEQHA